MYYEDDNGHPKLRWQENCEGFLLTGQNLTHRGRVLEEDANFLWMEWEDAAQLVTCTKSLYKVLDWKNLSCDYLVSNPHYRLQWEVYRSIKGAPDTIALIEDPDLEDYRNGETGVLLVPDYKHGDQGRIHLLRWILENVALDWFAIEMYPQSLQEEIDNFLYEPLNSWLYNKAKETLIQSSWTQLNPEDPYTEENGYFQLLVLCRELGIPVIALDTDIHYSLWNHGETPFGVAVRNRIWSQVLPKSGQGCCSVDQDICFNPNEPPTCKISSREETAILRFGCFLSNPLKME